ncbi:MAG: hypothetical protein KIT60_13905 [Burkholderiaceae bacterium]|nr:hypothetical protein [Burkholderiaceae bacterium]
MITVACDKRALQFIKGPVADRFYLLTGERLRALPDIRDLGSADFIVVSERVLRSDGDTAKKLRPLTPYIRFLAGCGGTGPSGFQGPSVAIGPLQDAGMLLDGGLDRDSSDVFELPEWLDFLDSSAADKLVLAATSDRALESRGKSQFYYLFRLTNSMSHFFPFVPSSYVQHSLTVGEKMSILPEDGFVSARMVTYQPDRHRAEFDLSVVNAKKTPIKGLEAYFAGSPAGAFANAHGRARFTSRVNIVGPVPGFRFGDLAVGDTITRRVVYDTSFGAKLDVFWSPRIAALQVGGDDGWGNGCTDKQPEPIPDPFPGPALAADCFDAGCEMGGDCPGGKHHCADGEDGCGCYPDQT